METRGLIGFRQNGVRKASYNHYDSYPKGFSADIINFILALSKAERVKMLEQIRKLTWTPNGDGVKCAQCLDDILKGTRVDMPDDSDFVRDTLFCEWAYYIDLEEEELEVWTMGRLICTVKFADLATLDLDALDEKRDELWEGLRGK